MRLTVFLLLVLECKLAPQVPDIHTITDEFTDCVYVNSFRYMNGGTKQSKSAPGKIVHFKGRRMLLCFHGHASARAPCVPLACLRASPNLCDKATQASRSPQGCDWSANYIPTGVTLPVSRPIIPAETKEDFKKNEYGPRRRTLGGRGPKNMTAFITRHWQSTRTHRWPAIPGKRSRLTSVCRSTTTQSCGGGSGTNLSARERHIVHCVCGEHDWEKINKQSMATATPTKKACLRSSSTKKRYSA